jgi:hypothetical protein
MDNPIPYDTESPRERKDRHATHQAMLEQHRQDKAAARERHKKDHGRGYVYPGHLY